MELIEHSAPADQTAERMQHLSVPSLREDLRDNLDVDDTNEEARAHREGADIVLVVTQSLLRGVVLHGVCGYKQDAEDLDYIKILG